MKITIEFSQVDSSVLQNIVPLLSDSKKQAVSTKVEVPPQVAPTPPVAPTSSTASGEVITPNMAAVPVSNQAAFNIEEVSRAAATAIEQQAVSREQIISMIQGYGVAALTHMNGEQLNDFAVKLRGLGVQI